jgi:cytochrome P450
MPTPAVGTLHPWAPEVTHNPYPILAYLRQNDPVHWDEPLKGYLVTRYEDVASLLRDHRMSHDRIDKQLSIHSPEERESIELFRRHIKGWTLYMNPPEHTRVRRLYAKAFSKEVAAALPGHVERLTDELIDQVVGRGEMDVMRDFAYPLPMNLLGSLLGTPKEDLPLYKEWTQDIATALSTGLRQLHFVKRATTAVEHLSEHLSVLIEKRRREPRNDLISSFVAAERNGEVRPEEIISMCALLLVSGHHTTMNLIGNGLLALLRHPEALDTLRKDLSLMPTAVEELIRFDPSVQALPRLTTEEIEIAGKRIPPDSFVFVVFAAANRDPAQFADPDQLVLTRADNPHLSFSGGVHFCAGTAVARVELQIAFSRLLSRLPGLRLATETLSYYPGVSLRGLKALPVRFDS